MRGSVDGVKNMYLVSSQGKLCCEAGLGSSLKDYYESIFFVEENAAVVLCFAVLIMASLHI